MKTVLCFVLVVLVVAGIFEAALPPADNNMGGYHDREVTDKVIQEMAAFAAQEMGHELVEILAAQSQVCRFYLFISRLWQYKEDFFLAYRTEFSVIFTDAVKSFLTYLCITLYLINDGKLDPTSLPMWDK